MAENFFFFKEKKDKMQLQYYPAGLLRILPETLSNEFLDFSVVFQNKRK